MGGGGEGDAGAGDWVAASGSGDVRFACGLAVAAETIFLRDSSFLLTRNAAYTTAADRTAIRRMPESTRHRESGRGWIRLDVTVCPAYCSFRTCARRSARDELFDDAALVVVEPWRFARFGVLARVLRVGRRRDRD